MLRDPSGRRLLRILEQNYRADPVSLEALMKRYEGQTIEFQVRNGDKVETVTGKIVRAGGAVQPMSNRMAYPNAYAMSQPSMMQALIEVAGKLRFDLPGVPLFPGPGRRNDPETDARLEPSRRTAPERWMPSWHTFRAGSIGARITTWCRAIPARSTSLAWVTTENRSGKRVRKRAREAHGRRCQQDSKRNRI